MKTRADNGRRDGNMKTSIGLKCKWLSCRTQEPPFGRFAQARRTFCPADGAKSGPAGRCGWALRATNPPGSPCGATGGYKTETPTGYGKGI